MLTARGFAGENCPYGQVKLRARRAVKLSWRLVKLPRLRGAVVELGGQNACGMLAEPVARSFQKTTIRLVI